jgi:glycosyltransferase involved in cell wall biosynthesis
MTAMTPMTEPAGSETPSVAAEMMPQNPAGSGGTLTGVRPRNVAYVYHLDAGLPRVQSGRPHSILKQFRKLGIRTTDVFPLDEAAWLQRAILKVGSRLCGREYLMDRNEALLRSFARQAQQALRHSNPDVIFSPSTLPLSYLETDVPITFCADAPFGAMLDYYGPFTRLTRRQRDFGEKLEARVLERCALAVYPSAWAAEWATRHYGIPREKVAVIPFGANIGGENTAAEVAGWIENRLRGPLRLLFVGREWERKGGEIVLETVRWLAGRGMPLRLDFVGCKIPAAFRNRGFVTEHGNLREGVSAERTRLGALLQAAHLLFVPSRAEAYGMSFCEANAFGVPCVSTATGGICGIIEEGRNGALLPLEAGPEEYGKRILEMTSSPEHYRALALSSFREYCARLNWGTFGECLTAEMALVCRRTGAPSQPEPLPPERHKGAVFGTETNRIRMAYVADDYFDPTNPRSWSGTAYFVARALERAGVEVMPLKIDSRTMRLRRYLLFIAFRLFGLRYLRDRDSGLLRAYARQIEQRLGSMNVNFVFCPGTAPLAYLSTHLPVAFWSDGTFEGMTNFYGSFSHLAARSLEEGHAADRLALKNATLALYASEWAARSAREFYGAAAEKVHVIPFGANLTQAPTETEVRESIRTRSRDRCVIFFSGVDWERKGADVAIEAAAALRAAGVETRLVIAGCHPARGREMPDWVEITGFISKETPEGRARLEGILKAAHFFILPSRAEAYGLVFCEANAFGVPCLAPAVGGIPTIIRPGVNGQLFPENCSPADYAAYIQATLSDRAAYENLALGSFHEFRRRLNWDVAAEHAVALMREALVKKSPQPAIEEALSA